ncbi:ABC transporter ATP-binding protein [Clostridium sp. DL1XJH146]
MNRILKYIKKYSWLYLLGFIAMGIGISLDMYNPIITRRIVDEVIVDGNIGLFKTLAFMLIGITVGRAVSGYAKEMLFDYIGVQISTSLRQEIFDHIQSLSYNFFNSKNTGELMARIKEDAEKVWFGVSFGFMLVVELIISIIVATILMVRISPKLSLISFAIVPLLGYLAYSLEKTIGKTYESISEQNAILNTTAQENITGVRLVKAFAREKYEINKFLEKNKNYYKLNVKQSKIWSIFYPRLEFLTNILPILVITLGGTLVIQETLTIGTLIEFSGYMYMVIWPMRLLGWVSNIMAEAFASIKKINTVFNNTSEIENKENGKIIDTLRGDILFQNVSLTIDNTEVLKNINFTISPRKTLAVMGATGSGKSSLINLLTRFVDNTSGNIKIDGVNITDYDLSSLRSHISVVMQDTFLFSDTIQENILFGRNENSKNNINNKEDLLISSSISAQAHDFIDRMEKSYETVIGEKGIGLSGGQKQRISIARALAKEAEILIFDDATSALDMETEYQIQKELEAKKDITKIIIAHRISAVKDADEIIILHRGEIVERGTHQSLLDQKGRYYQTYCEQYEGFVS